MAKSQTIRLNKLISERGIASRRRADQMIQDGEITVNGKKVFELGIQVDPSKDKILIQGKPIQTKFENLYIMVNKPTGYLTTLEDPLDRPTIKNLLHKVPTRVFPVGRLDWDSEGLLLLTNDGEFANKVTNPKSEVTKTYLVKLDGQPTPEKLNRLLTGVTIPGGKVKARHVEKITRGKDKNAWVKIIITEGKNRQIRKMFEKIGFDVLKLQRVAIGRLRLGQLEKGAMVYLNEVAASRVFLADSPQDLESKRSYKGRNIKRIEEKPVEVAKSKFKPRQKNIFGD